MARTPSKTSFLEDQLDRLDRIKSLGKPGKGDKTPSLKKRKTKSSKGKRNEVAMKDFTKIKSESESSISVSFDTSKFVAKTFRNGQYEYYASCLITTRNDS